MANEITFKSVADVKFLSVAEIETNLQEVLKQQIRARKETMNQMVGSLYPSILSDEIDKLHGWLEAISKKG